MENELDMPSLAARLRKLERRCWGLVIVSSAVLATAVLFSILALRPQDSMALAQLKVHKILLVDKTDDLCGKLDAELGVASLWLKSHDGKNELTLSGGEIALRQQGKAGIAISRDPNGSFIGLWGADERAACSLTVGNSGAAGLLLSSPDRGTAYVGTSSSGMNILLSHNDRAGASPMPDDRGGAGCSLSIDNSGFAGLRLDSPARGSAFLGAAKTGMNLVLLRNERPAVSLMTDDDGAASLFFYDRTSNHPRAYMGMLGDRPGSYMVDKENKPLWQVP